MAEASRNVPKKQGTRVATGALDAESSAMIAQGNPQELATDVQTDPKVREFLFRPNLDKTRIGQQIPPIWVR